MSEEAEFSRALFTPQPPSGEPIQVHFNPESLQLTITNTLSRGRGSRAQQYVSQSTAKLAMELLFDTTDRGTNVRADTEKIALLMEPKEERNRNVPAIVKFEFEHLAFLVQVNTSRSWHINTLIQMCCLKHAELSVCSPPDQVAKFVFLSFGVDLHILKGCRV